MQAVAIQVLESEGKLSLDVFNRSRAEIAQVINETATTGAISAKSPHEAFFRQKVLGGVGSLIDPNRVAGNITTGLTNKDDADAKAIAERITDRLLQTTP